jgi:hypothetical protein
MSSFYSTFSPLLVVFGPPALAAILAMLTVAVKKAFEHMPTAQRNTLTSIVSTCVNAVEQSAPNMPNAVKKQLAESAIEAQLAHFGLKVPSEVVDANLEEAVLILNIAQGKAAKATVAPIQSLHPSLIPSNLTGTKDHE